MVSRHSTGPFGERERSAPGSRRNLIDSITVRDRDRFQTFRAWLSGKAGIRFFAPCSGVGARRLTRGVLAALISFCAHGALAANVRMDLGPLEQRPGAIVRQWVRLANAGVESIPRLYVQCTFFFLGRARSSGGAYTAGLKPGQALSISVGGGDTRADRAECAIKDIDRD